MEVKKQLGIVKSEANKELQYLLLEKYIKFYNNSNFNIESTAEFQIFKSNYNKVLNSKTYRNMLGLENKIIFDTLLTLENIFLDFKKDNYIILEQLKSSFKINLKILDGSKKDNLLNMLDLFNKFYDNIITKEELLNSNLYQHFWNCHYCFNKVNYNKNKVLNDIVLILNDVLLYCNDKKRTLNK